MLRITVPAVRWDKEEAVKHHLIGVVFDEPDINGWIYPGWIASDLLFDAPTYFAYCPNCGSRLPAFKDMPLEDRQDWACSEESRCYGPATRGTHRE